MRGKEVSMFHLVFALLSLTLLVMGWLLVHNVHPLVARILPKNLAFMIGAGMAMLGVFNGFMEAYYFRNAEGVFGCFVMIMMGNWFMLATSANARGSWRDEQLMKRIFLMIGLIFLVVTFAMYMPQHQAIAIVNLILMTGGLYVTTTFLKQVDSGR
jgi:hypothetical protein